MSAIIIPGVPPIPETNDVQSLRNYIEQLSNLVAMVFKEVDWGLNGNISSQNISIIAGYRASDAELKHISGLVGMSGFDAANPLAVRFWAGSVDKDLALFRVLQNGKFFATDGELTGKIEALSGHIGGFTIEADKLSSDSGTGIIQGGTVRTGAPGSARVEMKVNSVQTFNNDDHLQGPVWGETNPSATYGDFSLYDDGVEVIRFENQLAGNGYLIKSVGGISSLRLGGVGRNTQGTGTWRFYGDVTFDLDISGKISEAYFADHAATASAADELSPSGEIAWGQVLKSGSNIADLATKNLSSLTEDSAHRTVTDTEKSTWNGKANPATTLSGYGITDGMKVLSGGTKTQSGTGGGTVATAGVSVTVTITFDVPFSSPPVGIATLAGVESGDLGYIIVRVASTTTTTMSVIINSYLAQGVTFSWVAVGS